MDLSDLSFKLSEFLAARSVIGTPRRLPSSLCMRSSVGAVQDAPTIIVRFGVGGSGL